jgi:hypothetical protein
MMWTTKDVNRLRDLYQSGLSRKKCAEAFGLLPSTIKSAIERYDLTRSSEGEGSKLKSLTGVGAFFSAAHRDKATESVHGHSFEVIAWWREGRSAIELQQTLSEYLGKFDHTMLPDNLAWGEALGKQIIRDLGCVKVEINRPIERLYAVTERK